MTVSAALYVFRHRYSPPGYPNAFRAASSLVTNF